MPPIPLAHSYPVPSFACCPAGCAPSPGGERCRADALLIRVKTVQSEPCFANTANAPLSSQLDIIQERGGGPCKGTALRSRVGGRKKARRAMPWGRIG